MTKVGKMIVFVSSEADIPQDHRLGDLNIRNIFLTLLEAGKSKVKVLGR